MDASELLKKESIYKALAIGLILVFLGSSYTAGWLNGGRSVDTGGTQVVPDLSGEAVLNATVLEYKPYIVTDVHNATLAESLRQVPGVDDVVSSSQGYVVSVGSGASVTDVYSNLSARGITGTANAYISLPPVFQMTVQNYTENITGVVITSNIEPIFNEKENISVRIFLQTQSQQITGWGTATVLPSQTELVRNATVVALADSVSTIRVPWAQRNSVGGLVANLTSVYGNSSVSYSKKDFVVANITGTKPAYVTFVAADTVFVQGNFTDEARISADMPGAQFPDSGISVKGRVGANQSGGYNATYAYTYNVKIIDEAGNPMFFALQSANAYGQNESVPVIVSAYAIKDKIVSVISAKEA